MLPGGIAAFSNKMDYGHATRGARSNFFVSHSGTKSIRSIAPRYWNALPLKMKQTPSIAPFKVASKLGLLAPYGSFVCAVRSCATHSWFCPVFCCPCIFAPFLHPRLVLGLSSALVLVLRAPVGPVYWTCCLCHFGYVSLSLSLFLSLSLSPSCLYVGHSPSVFFFFSFYSSVHTLDLLPISLDFVGYNYSLF